MLVYDGYTKTSFYNLLMCVYSMLLIFAYLK